MVAALLASPLSAQSQGVVRGVQRGVTGSVDGMVSANQAQRFRDQALREHRSSYRYDQPLRPGALLPPAGMTYRAAPPEYRVNPRYRYTIINNHAVLVDPTTRRVVQVIH